MWWQCLFSASWTVPIKKKNREGLSPEKSFFLIIAYQSHNNKNDLELDPDTVALTHEHLGTISGVLINNYCLKWEKQGMSFLLTYIVRNSNHLLENFDK